MPKFHEGTGEGGSSNFVLVDGATWTGDRKLADTGEFHDDYNSAVFDSGVTIVISDMYVWNHEVTRAEFRAITGLGDSSNYPKVDVNMALVIAYCNKKSVTDGLTPAYSVVGFSSNSWNSFGFDNPSDVGYGDSAVSVVADASGWRLPTSAEWEYLARGGDFGGFADKIQRKR